MVAVTKRCNFLRPALLTALFFPSALFASGVVATNTQSALAAAMAGGGTVKFDPVGTIYLTSTIGVSTNTVLDGTGSGVSISGSNAVEIFMVSAGATLSITNLTFVNGAAPVAGFPPDAFGGAILNAGTLQLTGCTFASNYAAGGETYLSEGGAIYNSGTLQMTNCAFISNSATSGSVGSCEGGAIYNSGNATGSKCTFVGNLALGSSGQVLPPANYQYSGGLGSGGAVFNENQAVFTGCTFSNNTAAGGVGGDYGSDDPFNGLPGGAAQGGALCNSGTLLASNSTFTLNLANGGVGGGGGYEIGGNYQVTGGAGATGGAGDGGAFCCVGGSCSLVNDTFLSNSAYGGAGGVGGVGESGAPPGSGGNGGPGGIGSGGAFCVLAGSVMVSNIVASSNSAAAGKGGAGGAGGYQPPIYENIMGPAGAPGSSGQFEGGGLGILGGSVTMEDSVFLPVAFTNMNIFGPVIDYGNNSSFDDYFSLTNSTSYNGVNPPPLNRLILRRPASGILQLGYAGSNGQTFRIQESVDLMQWLPVVTNTLGSSGFVNNSFPTTNYPAQFFRAVSP